MHSPENPLLKIDTCDLNLDMTPYLFETIFITTGKE